MNPGSQKGIKLAMGGLGLVGLALLGFALIGMNLPPLLVLAVVIVGIALPIFMLKPEAAIHLFVALTFLESAGTVGSNITVGKVIGPLILGSWLLSVAVNRRLNLKVNGLVISLLAFLGWSCLSITQAYDNEAAIRQNLTFAQLIIAMLMVASVVNTPESLQRVLRTLVLATTCAAAHGLLTYALGRATTTAGLVGNRNGMATYLTVAIPCALLLYQMARSSLERLALMVALPIQFVTLALTFSRTGVIALGVVIMMLGYRLALHRRFRLLGVSAAMILLIGIGLPSSFYDRVETIGSSVRRQEDTFGQRVQLAEAGMRMIVDRPVLGVGAGNYPVVLARYGRTGYLLSGQWASHNTFVALAAESGLPALVLFSIGIAAAFRILRVTIRRATEVRSNVAYQAIAVEAALVAFMVSGLTGNMEKFKFLYVFLGLVLSLDGIRQRLAASAPAVAAPITTSSLAIPVLTTR